MGDFSTTIPGAFTVERLKASELEILRQALDALTSGMTDYSSSFVIGATTTPPTKGSSTYVARYTRLGKLLFYNFKVTIGAGFSAGSGQYLWPIPFAGRVVSEQPGAVWILDSGTANYVGAAKVSDTSTSSLLIVKHGDSSPLGNAGPGTAWATGDYVACSVVLELA